jgi:hypothetical protein
MNLSSFSIAMALLTLVSKIDRDNRPGPGPTSTTKGVFSETWAVRTILSIHVIVNKGGSV